MKNRTIIGVICMVLAVVMTFAVAPLVNKLTSDTTEVVRLNTDIKQGSQITAEQLETVKVKKNTIPGGVVTNKSDIIGKYAASQLYTGDYLTETKLSGDSNTASDVLASLDGSKVAVSVTIDTFAAGLSGKLQNGDIISLIIVDKNSGKASIPGELKYMKVITTTTAGGIDQDSIVKNEDGSYEIPSTITVLANTEQAKLLAKYEGDTDMTAALVYRGTAENAKKFLDKQDAFFNGDSESAGGEDNTLNTDNAEGDDIIKQANDIINGNAEHFDVNEVVNGNE